MTAGSFPDLASVRAALDELDGRVVELLVERQHLVAQAAAFKHTDSEVQAPQRVAAVVRRARQLAEQHGGSGDLVEQVYTALVAAFVAHERAALRASTT
ncbi:chorismate mutase [Angustibacter sp. Root456]|uniref:chorismate mutase n=1 Tax=Angustibacter sp. Root456 TaxID=1736539 RepID=UPI0006F9B1AA|nr:chorismate mutase [Angustibacter sp. Root456]KQX64521.1 hypothetical protein ASD06_10230 [Angustibacter sp. Root456]